MRTALLSFVLALSCFLSGFGLVIPEEWAKTDPEFDITIDSRKQDPGFLIPLGYKGNTPSIVPIPDDTEDITIVPIPDDTEDITIVPIPDDTEADNDITIVPIEP